MQELLNNAGIEHMENNGTPISIKNVVFNNYVIIYSLGSDIYFYDRNNKLVFFLPCCNIVMIEKRTCVNIKLVRRKPHGDLYQSFLIGENKIKKLLAIINPDKNFEKNELLKPRKENNNFFRIKEKHTGIQLFELLKKSSNEGDIYILAYFFSLCGNRREITASLLKNSFKTFSEQIKDIINGDISKKWRLSDIAEKLNLSDVAVRKKLEAESLSFNKIMQNVKMSAAIYYLLFEQHHVNKIADMLGIASASYFIRLFKEHYGITPKQLLIGLRDNA
ncbi:AraC family transcriptional regulator [Escherichia fergusonii]|uniref:helix-turn-helix transcriptional regulator n=1 Tax=Escherichia fergusonii TaxID=564 RepID=UPI001EBBAB94|nr:helix-turn-helix transcriptional regulator [Escherichia fergusonii]EHJ4136044.1 helix-turn-helix transcriptional regulator [Escherichia fergusonii]